MALRLKVCDVRDENFAIYNFHATNCFTSKTKQDRNKRFSLLSSLGLFA